MANATDQQVQTFSDARVRPHCELIRSVFLEASDDKANMNDVYSALTQQSPTWADNRTDGPPHLVQPADVLAYNAFITDLIAFISGHGAWPVVQELCVQPVRG